MATMHMATKGPASPLIPTLELVPIGPKVQRPRVTFGAPRAGFGRQPVPSNEYSPADLFRLTAQPPATHLNARPGGI